MDALQGLLVVVGGGEWHHDARGLINAPIQDNDQPVFDHLWRQMVVRIDDNCALGVELVITIVAFKDLPYFGREIYCHPFLPVCIGADMVII